MLQLMTIYCSLVIMERYIELKDMKYQNFPDNLKEFQLSIYYQLKKMRRLLQLFQLLLTMKMLRV